MSFSVCPQNCVSLSCTRASSCGACNNGWYGNMCETSCMNCGGDMSCNKASGVCSSNSCVDGYYGSTCTSTCSTSCPGRTCRFDNGYCDNCPDGYYGRQCLDRCDAVCVSCLSRSYCESCVTGKYGVTCVLGCPNCGGQGICNKDDGVCQEQFW